MILIGAMALTACMFVSPQNESGGLPAVDGHAFFEQPEFCGCCHEVDQSDGTVEAHGFTVEISEHCGRCHGGRDLGLSHPVDVVATDRFPDMEIPEEMPVDGQGRITCGTCHNPHLPGHSTERFAGGQEPSGSREVDGFEVDFYKSYRLRFHAPDAGNDPTCAACHQQYFTQDR